MKVLVIGGTRFIGRFVVQRLLERGHQPVVFHRGAHEIKNGPDVMHIHGERRDLPQSRRRFESIGIEAAIDMIAMGPHDSLPVREALTGRIKRLVAVSSADTYLAWEGVLQNKTIAPLPLSESDPVREGRFPYKGKWQGAENYDKIIVEEEYINCSRNGSFDACIVRLPMVYGPYDGQRRTHPYDEMALKGQTIIKSGAGIQWVVHRGYVENIAAAIVSVLEKGRPGEIYNAADAKAISEWQWIDAIFKYFNINWKLQMVSDADLPPEFEHLSYQSQHIILDTEKIRRDCGHRDAFPFAEGLRRTLEFRKKEISAGSK